MDFDLSEDQRRYHDEVVEFARGALAGDVVRRDADGTFPRQAWLDCARFGIQGLPVPERYGGVGADATTTILALEALGYGCRDNGLIFSLNAQMWACEIPLVRFGTEEQRRRYLPGLCDGSLIAAHAMTEPGSGSDAFALATVAERRGDRFVLNGSKTFATNAPVADLFIVFATTDPGRGYLGLCAFVVERDDPGLELGRPLHKMGLRTSPMSEVFLTDCEVGADRVIGRPGRGAAVFNASMEWERGCILASTVGTMRRQLESCVDYAKEREQFGLPIGSFQAVSHRIVEMRLRLETARLMVYRLAWMMDGDRATPLDAALTKLHLSDCFTRSSLDALQVHGGYGYMAEYEFEREVRDALGSGIYSGTSDVLRNLVAGQMGL